MEPQTPHDEVQTMVADLNRVELQLVELRGTHKVFEAKVEAAFTATTEQIGGVKEALAKLPGWQGVITMIFAGVAVATGGFALVITFMVQSVDRHDTALTSLGVRISELSSAVGISSAAIADLKTELRNQNTMLVKVYTDVGQLRTDSQGIAQAVSAMRSVLDVSILNPTVQKRLQPILDYYNVEAFLGPGGEYVFFDLASNMVVRDERKNELQAKVSLIREGAPVTLDPLVRGLTPQPRP